MKWRSSEFPLNSLLSLPYFSLILLIYNTLSARSTDAIVNFEHLPKLAPPQNMSNLTKLEFVALDISGNNYLSWILDAEIHLDASKPGRNHQRK